jgi:hypothetical protein
VCVCVCVCVCVRREPLSAAVLRCCRQGEPVSAPQPQRTHAY